MSLKQSFQLFNLTKQSFDFLRAKNESAYVSRVTTYTIADITAESNTHQCLVVKNISLMH